MKEVVEVGEFDIASGPVVPEVPEGEVRFTDDLILPVAKEEDVLKHRVREQEREISYLKYQIEEGKKPKELQESKVEEGIWPGTGQSNTPLDVALGFLYAYGPDAMLVLTDIEGTDLHVRFRTKSGMWGRNDFKLRTELSRMAEKRVTIIDNADLKSRLMGNAGKPVFLDHCVRSLGEAYNRSVEAWKPHGMGWCLESDLDANKRYLGCANGIVDLHEGRLLGSEEIPKGVYVTPRVDIDFNPDAVSPLFDTFLGNYPEDVREFLQDAAGHSMHRLPGRRIYVLWGEPASGKTALAEVIQGVFPQYARKMSNVALTAKQDELTPELAPMVGYAFTFVEEELGSGAISTNRVKDLTGGGSLTWRPLWKGEQVDEITGTLYCFSNEFPNFAVSDPALMDRMAPIHLDSIPEEKRVSNIARQIKRDTDARQAILAWLVAGAARNIELPAKPQWMADEIRRVEEEAEKDSDHAIREGLVFTGNPDDRINKDRLWDWLREEVGLNKNETATRDGYSRRKIPGLVNDIAKKKKVHDKYEYKRAKMEGYGKKTVYAYIGVRFVEDKEQDVYGGRSPVMRQEEMSVADIAFND